MTKNTKQVLKISGVALLALALVYGFREYSHTKEKEIKELRVQVKTLEINKSQLTEQIYKLNIKNKELLSEVKSKELEIEETKDKDGNYRKVTKIKQNNEKKSDKQTDVNVQVDVKKEEKENTVAKEETIDIKQKKEKETKKVSSSIKWYVIGGSILACVTGLLSGIIPLCGGI